jgi:23S rRNA pseudouridine2605 synthase
MKLSDRELSKLRLQVFLSRNGVCSRRRAFDIIKEGRVRLNGQVCREPSTPVDGHKDQIAVDGKEVKQKSYDYILMNKPAGVVTTKSDRHAQRTVLDILPKKFHHLSPVGRLDKDTEGLLLLTNDGEAAQRLTHPKYNIDKTYYVRLLGRLEAEKRRQVEKGVNIDGKKTYPAKIQNVKFFSHQTELTITIHEGRKRQIRLMFAEVGHQVIYLKRLRQGPLTLGPLKTGAWRLLTKQEIDQVQKL